MRDVPREAEKNKYILSVLPSEDLAAVDNGRHFDLFSLVASGRGFGFAVTDQTPATLQFHIHLICYSQRVNSSRLVSVKPFNNFRRTIHF